MKNQKIHRKEIIKSIIAESAIEHGFKLEWGTRTRTTWYILSMTREGLGQCIHFVEDSVFPGVLTVMGIYNQDCRFNFDINNEESYKKIVLEIKDILESEGYKILDERRNLPKLTSEDLDYIADKYTRLATAFCEEKGIDIRAISLVDAINAISDSVKENEHKKWEDVKSAFYKLAGFYLYILLTLDGLELYRRPIDDERKSLEIRRTDNKYIRTIVVQPIFGDWRRGAETVEIKTNVYHTLNALLTIDQLNKYGIEVEEWKRFNESLAQDEY